jgi:hypothetical protein
MPLLKCEINGKPGWKWGKSGKCFSGSDGRQKALEQGRAIEASKTQRVDDADPDVEKVKISHGVNFTR